MNFLRQSTASQSRDIGPFVDDTDFKTAETALTIANTDIKLMANGGASANKNSGGGTHRVNGFYGVTFDATDTATVGELVVSVVVAGALPVFKTFYVIEEAIFDALFAASAAGYSTYAGADTSGTTTLLSRLSSTRAGYLDNLSAGAVAQAAALSTVSTRVLLALPAVAPGAKGGLYTVIDSGIAVAIDSNTITLAGGFLGDPTGTGIIVESAAGWENKNISGIDATGFIATVATPLTLNHTAPISYTFYSLGAVTATNYATSDDIAAQNSAIANNQAGITAIKDVLPSALSADGNMLVDVQTVKGAAQTAGDLGGLSTAIKVKTDQLNFTLSGKVDGNIKAVADDLITGSGTDNDKWRPA